MNYTLDADDVVSCVMDVDTEEIIINFCGSTLRMSADQAGRLSFQIDNLIIEDL